MMAAPRRYASLIDRICANVELIDAPRWMDNELGPCWIWQRSKNQRGYGAITMRKPGFKTPRRVLVHRLVLNLFFGIDLNTVECSMHQCSRKQCCNPLHLHEGTNLENMQFYYETEKPLREAIRECGG